jgi:hypothetical protein
MHLPRTRMSYPPRGKRRLLSVAERAIQASPGGTFTYCEKQVQRPYSNLRFLVTSGAGYL